MIKNVLSCFDGISGARVALERAGFKIEKYYSSEIDKHAIQIAQKNYPDTIQVGDITKLKGKDFKDIDLIVGGFPCQDLSIAKKNRQGLQGERSSLFWEFVRLVEEIKPKYFLLENVNSMSKESKEIITKALGVEPVMINAALVSAQNRKRLFWANFPINQPADRGILLKDVLEKNVSEDFYIKGNYKTWLESEGGQKRIDKGFIKINPDKAKGLMARDYANWSGNMVRIGQIGKGSQVERIYSPDGKSVSLSANGGGGGAKTGLYLVKGKSISHKDLTKVTDNGYETNDSKPEIGQAKRVYNTNGKMIPLNTWSPLISVKAVAQRGRNLVDGKRKDILGAKTEQRMEVGGDKANTITSVFKDSMVLENQTIRKLTPIECSRLQCFSDNWNEKGINEKGEEVLISNTQRYKALGNSFCVEVVRHIFECLKNPPKETSPIFG